MNSHTSTQQDMIQVNKEEYDALVQLSNRLIEDKKEMEEEFKEILSAITDDIEMREKIGEILGKKELESFKAMDMKPEVIIETIKQQEATINDLQARLSKLEKSKLGKLQLKYWQLRKRNK
ncbi:hypothetical protein GJU41_10005 [Bacillus idriensis]|uniref:Uncharacterized protein n=1 Tax=Metabacillus idriensis TaxID=324768 RepID=A0A6I2MBE3_9BACI|nr:hypothetical protein [Metabacillus idriensis]MRX54306.1 hypothetical protein [Metabacillus idriensis]